jgi:arylsulfatase A-like enzyme
MAPPTRPNDCVRTRRWFVQIAGAAGLSALLGRPTGADSQACHKPNIILCMTDDQGWGDVAYNGHPVLKTPNLDAMAAAGIRFDRFYSGAPVCSPTRGACVTGRHPYRYGIYFANSGHMKKDEITLAEILKRHGYATGHFGKWHLGTLTKDIKDGRRGGRQNEHYSPPWENGFDECFATEQAVPTWDPMEDQPFETRYWTGAGRWAKDNLDGDDSRVIMDRAVPFVRKAVQADKPFLAIIWFHTPHSRVVAGPQYRAMYADQDENHQHYYGCITAMDEQMGRLRAELKTLGVADTTMLWFCSDNGPAGRGGGTRQTPGARQQGSAGPFRGRKGSLYEGGVRVPGILIWPEKVKQPRVVDMPCVTSDYFPTILDVLGYRLPEAEARPYDGVSLLRLIEGRMRRRNRPIGFESKKNLSLVDDQYKLYSADGGETFELYDLIADPGEKKDLASDKPEIVTSMRHTLQTWRASCKASNAGDDYR